MNGSGWLSAFLHLRIISKSAFLLSRFLSIYGLLSAYIFTEHKKGRILFTSTEDMGALYLFIPLVYVLVDKINTIHIFKH